MTDSAARSVGRTDTISANLARNWWIMAVRGLLAIAFGIVAFVWPGVTMLVIGGITSFALKAKSIVTALRSLRTLKQSLASGEGKEVVEVPISWFFWGFGGAAILCLVTQKVVFDMPLWTPELV